MRAALILTGLSFGTATGADDPSNQAVPAAIRQYLREVKGAEWGTLQRVTDQSLRTVFPQVEFASLRFRKFPSEVVPPAPLGSNNVFAARDKKVMRISTVGELSKFFVERFPARADEATIKAGTEVWLRLAAALNQDEFYEFTNPVVRVSEGEASGTIGVKPDTGKGELRVTMRFKDGRLVEIIPGGKLVPGRRYK